MILFLTNFNKYLCQLKEFTYLLKFRASLMPDRRYQS